ncbi:uncharacterized protein LOC115093239 [Rhinatrema bivittatum]|uniref:uncharacterized protein LOC115093239 n=1 Tax=Rhinatrema bivittatum TaxID=194408 RepID=UPI00112D8232|nr:uncharacterized protein LOC115093239 [Rhinatrema bivittatum]
MDKENEPLLEYPISICVNKDHCWRLSFAWIIGHSYVRWAHKRAQQRPTREYLGMVKQRIALIWKGISGMVWDQLLQTVLELRNSNPVTPTALVIHLGGNDMPWTKSVALTQKLQKDILVLHNMFPQSVIVWSCITPRRVWRGERSHAAVENARKKINRWMVKFMSTIDGLSVMHELIDESPGMFRHDGIHLSDIGWDIFNSDLQDSIQAVVHQLAAAWLGGGSPVSSSATGEPWPGDWHKQQPPPPHLGESNRWFGQGKQPSRAGLADAEARRLELMFPTSTVGSTDAMASTARGHPPQLIFIPSTLEEWGGHRQSLTLL